jgi:hypothetical protein
MKFKQIKKRKIYSTWVGTKRNDKFKAYIFEIPNLNLFHFHILYDDNIIFVSLDYGIKFNSFDECVDYIERWINKNRKDYE